MATPAQVQASLNAVGPMAATILMSAHSFDTLKEDYYVVAGTDAPGRCRWVQCTASDSAATQAAAILTALRLG